MGVDIPVWRARIGMFLGGRRVPSKCGVRNFVPLGFAVLHILTICALLYIGGVERNPGPLFQCDACDSRPQFGTINEQVLHQKTHKLDKNFCFSCPLCSLKFATFNAIDMHVHYFHSEIRNVPQDNVTLIACNVMGCDQTFPSSKLLCQHLKKVHLESGVKTQCPFKDKCKNQHYFMLQTFSVHLSQYHKGWNATASVPERVVLSPSLDTESNENLNVFVSDESHLMDFNTGNEDDSHNANAPPNPREEKLHCLSEEFHRSLAILYLRLESLHLIPVSTINVIANTLAELTALNMSIMRESMMEELQDFNLPEDKKERAVNKVLSADHMFSCHHKDTAGPTFTTNALRKTYFKSHFTYIRPREINMSQDPNNRRCIYYCDIKKTLEMFLSDNEVQKQILSSFSRKSEVGIYEDYKDGYLHKKRMEKCSERCIDLLIFQDEFTPTKDLSSVANQYKILGVYYTVGNLCPHLRAKLDCKKLIMLVPDSKAMFTDFKLNLFKRIIRELKKLQAEGVTFLGEQVKVRLRFLLGDNKGQHEVGGYIQSFSSEYYCRYCEMSKTEINAEPWKVGPLRTAESYEEASQSVPPNRATFKGVSRPEWQCPFNELENFHVCDPSLPPCIGHDHYQGVINYDLSLILQYFVQKKWFTYDQLNRKIRMFKYHGHDSGNKPAPVKYEKKNKKKIKEPSLGGHAVQNLTLLLLLPFILDQEFIKDTDDPYWRLYISLKEITEIICAPSITLTQIGRLKVMIEDYMISRKELLGDGKPKHHYFTHFADLIEILGPIVHLSGLGFEQFHQFFKNAAKAGRNFVDLGLSLVKKYCLYLAYLSAGSPFTTGIKILESGITTALQRTIQFDEEFETVLESRNISDAAVIMKKIQVDDLVFKEGQWLLLGNLTDLEVITGVITSVILDKNSVYLVMEKHVAKYLPNIGIYSVNEASLGLDCIAREEISYPIPQTMYEWGSHDRCFSLKYCLSQAAPLN